MSDSHDTALLDCSVIIPCYNEERSLAELCTRLTNVFEQVGKSVELIFVDDGSTDGSLEVLQNLRRSDPRVKIIHFRKNFGKSQALLQGFHASCGQVLVTIDADLQDLPEEIPRLLEQMDRGVDLVSGWKQKRRDTLPRRAASRLFNRCAALITGINIHDFNCGLKAYRREVTRALDLYGEIYRFIPALAGWKGFRVGEVPVGHAPRKYGKSKYGAERILRGFFDLLTIIFLTKYTQRPLHLFGGIGFLCSSAGVVIDAYLAVRWFSGEYIGHRPLLLLGTLLIIVGLQFICFGLLGELLVFSTKKDVDGIVKDLHGFER